ncbi:hypothetical protein HanOQP8_Chr02g0053551 [Helianthus annuus]|nr:hypothetical protein HanOQP8_Chr02g0053551 [Helianthus annuus]
MADGGKSVTNNEALGADDEAETSVASVEDQLRKEMTVYEEESAKIKAANKSWYKTMISDSDYAEFVRFEIV